MSHVSTASQVYKSDDNILLRTAEPQDAEMIVDYFTTNRQYLKPWEPRREESFYTLDSWSKKLIKLSELHKLGLGYYLLILDKSSNTMCGTISFSNLSRFPFHACTVGYSVAEGLQGQGIMSRALKMAVDYMFSVQNMHRIAAGYMPHNERSATVLAKLGFRKEGYAKDYLLIDGKWQDHILTALTNPNWKSDGR